MRSVTQSPATLLISGLFMVIACAEQPRPDAAADSEPAEGAMAAEAQDVMAAEAEEAADVQAEAAEAEESGGEHDEGGEHREGREHDEGGEHGEGHASGEHSEGGEHGEEGEESGYYIGRDANWDTTRRGMRLTLSYDAARDAFTGTVHNTTEATICAVRVEVHLRGVELGPTERRDLAAGESMPIELPADGESFERWTAHPESSACGEG